MSNLNMNKAMKLSMLLLLLVSKTIGQVAIIDDKDGFTNVRENPDLKSKVIYKIKDFELFTYEMDDFSKGNEWVKIFVPENKYALGCEGLNNLEGYIHKSRLKPLEQLEKYNGKDFSFHYNLGAFTFENKIIDFADGKYISQINGRPYYGTDGEIPKNEIVSIDAQLGQKRISIPPVLYEDLFVLTNDFNIYHKNDMYYIEQWNSDGAGGYLLVWAIDSTSLVQRLIFKP